MTDSDPVPRRTGNKRERLIGGAARLLHEQGLARATLANVAQAADVPLGNVYYYFKTKDDLVQAVIEAQLADTRQFLRGLEQSPDPAERLRSLVDRWIRMRDVVARYGCPIGSLATQVSRTDHPDQDPAGPIAAIIEWAADQYRALGHTHARDRAVTLVAGIQGAAVLANTLRDPDLLTDQLTRLKTTLDEAGAPAPNGPR